MPTEFCRHIHTAGRRCGCPALRDQPYCFFHIRSRKSHRLLPAPVATHAPVPIQTIETVLDAKRQEITQYRVPERSEAPPSPALILDFPPLEDRESIQVAASMIVAALGRNLIDSRRAASMLYGLQVATAVTRPCIPTDDSVTYYVQTETVPGPDGEDISLDEDPAEDSA